MFKIAFKSDGSEKTNSRILNILEHLGGVNLYKILLGISNNTDVYYYIEESNDYNIITCNNNLPANFKLVDVNANITRILENQISEKERELREMKGIKKYFSEM